MMSRWSIYLLVIFALVAAITNASNDADSDDDRDGLIETIWRMYKAKHGKVYDEVEDKQRLENFKIANQAIRAHNANKNDSYSVGHNEFSDANPEEMDQLSGEISTADDRFDRFFYSLPEYTAEDRQDIPDSFDLRDDPKFGQCIGPIKKQLCGNCWSYAAVVPIEYGLCKGNQGLYTVMSEQHLVDCNSENGGCRGGDRGKAMKYYQTAGGAASTATYGPSTNTEGTCQFDPATAPVTVESYGRVKPNEIDIQSAIMKYGPVTAGIFTTDKFSGKLNQNRIGYLVHFYQSGVFADSQCRTDTTTHAVDLIGWGIDPKTGKKYWIMRNSWNTTWGIKGYMWIERGNNMCNIEGRVLFAKTTLTGNPLPSAGQGMSTSAPSKTNAPGKATTFAGSR